MRLTAIALVTTVMACRAAPRPRPVGTAAPARVSPSELVRDAPPAREAVGSSKPPPISVEQLLAGAGDLQAFALDREYDFDPDGASLVISAMPDAGRGATCIQSAQLSRCIEHAGFDRVHVLRALRDDNRPTIATPAWAIRLLDAAANAPDVDTIEVVDNDALPLLMVNGADGSRFALRRDGHWRLSEPKTGGKSSRPLYFGAVDMTRSTAVPSIGLMLGSYAKEGCVRSETVELVVLEIGDDHLEDLGSTVIGRGEWLALDPTFAPFDPQDPNHYRILLRPRVQQDGSVRLEIESRHTPKRLRDRKHACGVELAPREIDDVAKLIGSHRLADLLQASPE